MLQDVTEIANIVMKTWEEYWKYAEIKLKIEQRCLPFQVYEPTFLWEDTIQAWSATRPTQIMHTHREFPA